MIGEPARAFGLVRAIATVGALTLVSRVAGFVRDVLLAALLGAGPFADAFFVAFKLPNFLRRLFAEGAFNAGFVPLFAGTLEGEGRAAAVDFAREARAVLLAVLTVVVGLAMIAMPWLVMVLAPGFTPGEIRFDATVDLARITFPYLLFVSLCALYGGVLNSLGRFAAPAAAPILLNLALITALLLPAELAANRAHALAWAVFAAGALQLAWLIASARRQGIELGFARPRLTPRVRRLFQLMLPAALGAGVAQINLVVDLVFASLLPVGSVSFLYYADRLNQLPLGVVGIAVGTALLPLLARQIRIGQEKAALYSMNRALELALLLTLPAAAALVVLAHPIIHVLFERGAFGPAATTATAHALAAFALGLPAYVLVKVLTPGFHARQDTTTPVKIAIACLIANIVFIVILIGPLAHVGIALATALSNWLNAGLLALRLGAEGRLVLDPRLRTRLPRLCLATIAMVALLLGLGHGVAPLAPAIALAGSIAGGGLGFLLVAQLTGAMDLRELRAMVRGRSG